MGMNTTTMIPKYFVDFLSLYDWPCGPCSQRCQRCIWHHEQGYLYYCLPMSAINLTFQPLMLRPFTHCTTYNNISLFFYQGHKFVLIGWDSVVQFVWVLHHRFFYIWSSLLSWPWMSDAAYHEAHSYCCIVWHPMLTLVTMRLFRPGTTSFTFDFAGSFLITRTAWVVENVLNVESIQMFLRLTIIYLWDTAYA